MTWLTHQDFYDQKRKRLSQKLHETLRSCEEREDFMEALRRFRVLSQKDLKDSYDHNKLPLEKLLLALTALAEICLEAAFFFEEEWMRHRFGEPKSTLYIIGMGKFGGYEMTFHSDLDLIFLYSKAGTLSGQRPLTYQEYFIRLVQRLISHVSLVTRHGFAYKVDTKLRPSGRAGILVSSWSSFEDYHQGEARLWEKQALLKARPIHSEPGLTQKVSAGLAHLLWNRSYRPTVAEEIHHLRGRMERELAREQGERYNLKLGAGGIVDIEFIIQYLQLVHGQDSPALITPHSLTALRLLQGEHILEEQAAKTLLSAYLFYRTVETEMRAMHGSATEFFPESGERGEAIADHIGAGTCQEMRKQFFEYRHEVRALYQKVLGVT